MENIMEFKTIEGNNSYVNLDEICYFVKENQYVRFSLDNDDLDDDIIDMDFDNFVKVVEKNQFIELIRDDGQKIMINPNKIYHFGKYRCGDLNIKFGFRDPINLYLKSQVLNDQYENFKKCVDRGQFIEVHSLKGNYTTFINICYTNKIFSDDDGTVLFLLLNTNIFKVNESYNEIKDKLKTIRK
jgi:hypothetical protein